MTKRIGLIVGDDPGFAHAFLAACHQHAALEATLVEIGGISERHLSKFDCIVDRFSRWLPHYQAFLKAAALAGTRVLNDPFAPSADRFFALSVAARCGVPVPRMMLLPQKSYSQFVDQERSLGNLEYPLKWDSIAHFVGFPALLRPVDWGHDGGRRAEHLGEVFAAFDQTGEVPTMLQALPKGQVVSCICVGQDAVLVPASDAEEMGELLAPDVQRQLREAASKVVEALGWDVCGLRFMVAGSASQSASHSASQSAFQLVDVDPWVAIDEASLGRSRFHDCIVKLANLAVKHAYGAIERGARYPWDFAG